MLLCDRIAFWVHVGDNRLYLLRKYALSRVTDYQAMARFLLIGFMGIQKINNFEYLVIFYSHYKSREIP